jgi:hypothetical protein
VTGRQTLRNRGMRSRRGMQDKSGARGLKSVRCGSIRGRRWETKQGRSGLGRIRGTTLMGVMGVIGDGVIECCRIEAPRMVQFKMTGFKISDPIVIGAIFPLTTRVTRQPGRSSTRSRKTCDDGQ